ncbi:MAG: hypothetical protein U0457_06520 [Candidatus Sericytochromatia bacterium]
MGSYIPPVLQSWALGGVQAGLAAVYESRVHTISKMTVARAQFAGDTNVTMTDGSYNIRVLGGGGVDTPSAVPKSSTAFLANTTNTFNSGLAAPNNSWGKPVVIKVKRDEGSSEVTEYGIFNADGTIPGSDGTVAMNTLLNPFSNTPTTTTVAIAIPANYLSAPLSYTSAGVTTTIAAGAAGVIPAGASFLSIPRYKVNVGTGEIYVANAAEMIEHKNPDGIVNFQISDIAPTPPSTPHAISGAANDYFRTAANATGITGQQKIDLRDKRFLEGQDKVVGMVDFEGLQGGALSASQSAAADLSAVIQSLTSTLRATNESKKSILSLIK